MHHQQAQHQTAHGVLAGHVKGTAVHQQVVGDLRQNGSGRHPEGICLQVGGMGHALGQQQRKEGHCHGLRHLQEQ